MQVIMQTIQKQSASIFRSKAINAVAGSISRSPVLEQSSQLARSANNELRSWLRETEKGLKRGSFVVGFRGLQMIDRKLTSAVRMTRPHKDTGSDFRPVVVISPSWFCAVFTSQPMDYRPDAQTQEKNESEQFTGHSHLRLLRLDVFFIGLVVCLVFLVG